MSSYEGGKEKELTEENKQSFDGVIREKEERRASGEAKRREKKEKRRRE